MGDPRRFKKKYDTPRHPWRRDTLEAEAVLVKEYGLKTKTELWKMESYLKRLKENAKRLIPQRSGQANLEKQQIIKRLQKIGFLKPGAVLDDILEIGLKDILERRLQTVLFRKKLAKSVGQARQAIVHKHVAVGARKITSPSYLVSVEDLEKVHYSPTSKFSQEDHPERVSVTKEVKA